MSLSYTDIGMRQASSDRQRGATDAESRKIREENTGWLIEFTDEQGRVAGATCTVKSAKLFAQSDKSRQQITAYDLRATGITWRAVRGDDPLKIMSAAGHRSFATTQGYIREAEPLRDGFGDVFPTLPDRLLVGNQVIRKRSAENQVHEILVPKEGLEPSHPYG
jgi:hypothetical protein